MTVINSSHSIFSCPDPNAIAHFQSAPRWQRSNYRSCRPRISASFSVVPPLSGWHRELGGKKSFCCMEPKLQARFWILIRNQQASTRCRSILGTFSGKLVVFWDPALNGEDVASSCIFMSSRFPLAGAALICFISFVGPAAQMAGTVSVSDTREEGDRSFLVVQDLLCWYWN